MTDARLPSTIAAAVEHRDEVRKSVFLAHLAPVTSVEEADAVIAERRRLHWDARHHCTAMVVGPTADRQRSNDDGEPSGTAGVPMLEVLRHRNVTDVVAVVTRWFGGTLLGAGGLVRAYGGAVSSALDAATPVERVRMTRVTADVDHAEAGRVLAFLHQWAAAQGAVLDDPEYGRRARLGLSVSPDLVALLEDDVAALTGGQVTWRIGETAVVDRPGR